MLRAKLFRAAEEGRLARCYPLYPLSGLWRMASRARHWLYDERWFKVHRVDAKVISIGSLIAGGSGKTPLVHLLASRFPRCAIVSHGYLAKHSGLTLGDEGEMLARRLPHVPVFAGKDRVALAKQAVREGARIILLDDGFQHRRLERDVELIAIDAENPFGFDAFLPRGLLRDSVSRLSRADALFVQGRLAQVDEARIRKFTDAPLIYTRMVAQNPLQGKMGAVSAIARPQRFLSTLATLGVEVVKEWRLFDHANFPIHALRRFAEQCKALGAEALVCTEKDSVKWPDVELCLPVKVLRMNLEVLSREPWEQLKCSMPKYPE